MIGALVGLALVAAALWFVIRRRPTLASAIDALAHRPPGEVAGLISLLVLAILLNIALSGAMFSALISPWGKVGRLEMQALVASTALVNYLPVPGFLGRVAWHRAVNAIPARDSAKTVIQAMLMSAAVAGWLALSLFMAARTGVSVWLPALSPIPPLAIAAALIPTRRRVLAAAMLIRYVDSFATALRYYAAFELAGTSVGADGAMAFAAIGMIATMVPFVGNGLGLREWAVGLAAPFLAGLKVEQGVAAELINRAAEMPTFALLGSISIAWLAARRKSLQARSTS